jgi:hypothetical protein
LEPSSAIDEWFGDLSSTAEMAGNLRIGDLRKMSQVEEGLGGANEVRNNETVTTSRDAMPRPMGILSSAAVFGSFSLLLWMAVAFEVPWLHYAFGIPPIFGWYVSGTAFVLFPMLLFGVAMAWRELPTRNLRLLCQRLRLGRLSSHDMIWAICGFIGIAFASSIIAELALRVNPDLRVSPSFFYSRQVSMFWYSQHGFRCSLPISWAKNCVGAVTFYRGRKRPGAAQRGR